MDNGAKTTNIVIYFRPDVSNTKFMANYDNFHHFYPTFKYFYPLKYII